ncbi:DUF4097 domain-containing protein [Streptomyces sp. S07_1.15]|uniref:DUF4097 family beta strand repeat-containing protein n=1 Tax=Streptomyces sp. S07_1.15 TaxID=2873925 RepID=UPI001D13F36B|nr:DUF4097 family beta strand repeat-containing protein [Streptomyces sp. S07_1.15]MCC3651750.1 DUF4097 domain-containing protein [Streptomyces sp. S07_1.15]
MPARSQWSVTEARKFVLDAPVTAVHVRVVGGNVNIVGTEGRGPARLHIDELHGPPLTVVHEDSTLTIAYDDLPWQGFLQWLDRKGRDREVTVSVTVPAGSRVKVGTVGAGTVVSGVSGGTDLRGVSGDSTLAGLSGPVRAETVSGRVEAQAVTGDLRFNSVSGDLTVIEGSGRSVRADTVSGNMVIDLATAGWETDVRLNTVSGEVAVRLPRRADTTVEAHTAGGAVSCAFDDLGIDGHWGAKKISGRLGDGGGRLRVTSVTGAIALLRRPPGAEEDPVPARVRPPRRGPGTDPRGGPGNAAGAAEEAPGPDAADTTDSADTTDRVDSAHTADDKKVL